MKYLTYFKVYWQDLFNYRFDTAVYAFSGLVMPLLGLFIWAAISENNQQLGMGFSQIVFYFLAIAWCNEVTAIWGSGFISEEIKSGKIAGYFVKPFTILENFATNNIAEKTFKLTIVSIAVIFLGFFYSHLYNLHYTVKLELIPLTFLALIGSLIMMILIDVAIGLTAFWLDDASFVYATFVFTEILLAGKFVPIQFLPHTLQDLNFYLPFRYIVSFPVEIMMGSLNSMQIMWGFVVLFFWVITARLIQKSLYQWGIKNYQGFGG